MTDPLSQLPPGAIGLNERLNRLEHNDEKILLKLETLAGTTDVDSLRGRVDVIERAYVGRGSVVAMAGFMVVQFLVIIGEGLGLVYQALKH